MPAAKYTQLIDCLSDRPVSELSTHLFMGQWPQHSDPLGSKRTFEILNRCEGLTAITFHFIENVHYNFTKFTNLRILSLNNNPSGGLLGVLYHKPGPFVLPNLKYLDYSYPWFPPPDMVRQKLPKLTHVFVRWWYNDERLRNHDSFRTFLQAEQLEVVVLKGELAPDVDDKRVMKVKESEIWDEQLNWLKRCRGERDYWDLLEDGIPEELKVNQVQ